MSGCDESQKESRDIAEGSALLPSVLRYRLSSNQSNPSPSSVRVLASSLHQHLKEVFNQLDKQGTGKITEQDFGILLEIFGVRNANQYNRKGVWLDFTAFQRRLLQEFHCESISCRGRPLLNAKIQGERRTPLLTKLHQRINRLKSKPRNEEDLEYSLKEDKSDLASNGYTLVCPSCSKTLVLDHRPRAAKVRELEHTILNQQVELHGLKHAVEDLRRSLQQSDATSLAYQVMINKMSDVCKSQAEVEPGREDDSHVVERSHRSLDALLQELSQFSASMSDSRAPKTHCNDSKVNNRLSICNSRRSYNDETKELNRYSETPKPCKNQVQKRDNVVSTGYDNVPNGHARQQQRTLYRSSRLSASMLPESVAQQTLQEDHQIVIMGPSSSRKCTEFKADLSVEDELQDACRTLRVMQRQLDVTQRELSYKDCQIVKGQQDIRSLLYELEDTHATIRLLQTQLQEVNKEKSQQSSALQTMIGTRKHMLKELQSTRELLNNSLKLIQKHETEDRCVQTEPWTNTIDSGHFSSADVTDLEDEQHDCSRDSALSTTDKVVGSEDAASPSVLDSVQDQLEWTRKTFQDAETQWEEVRLL